MYFDAVPSPARQGRQPQQHFCFDSSVLEPTLKLIPGSKGMFVGEGRRFDDFDMGELDPSRF